MVSEAIEAKTSTPAENFCVVGVGASSGGLDAFKHFIKHIPPRSGLAFILVQHLDPNHESILVEIIRKFTQIPVHEITDNLIIEPDHIYVIPSNKLLTAKNGLLNIAARSADANENSYTIDHFLSSLAEVYQTQAIGVVLSGTGTDGTRGLGEIKKFGGITYAQKLDTAAYRGMPESAINAEVVDFVLSPEEIIKSILSIQQSILTSPPKKIAPELKAQEISFSKILTMLNNRRGVDFAYYKQTTIRRRIARRMVLKNFSNIQDYASQLETNEAELDLLFQDILIPVTDFFRDSKVFEFLQQVALPALMKSKAANEGLRIWIVGCSTGQEAYSLAMLVHEYFEQQTQRAKIQVFATDISDVAIIRARSGYYAFNEVGSISKERLDKFFIRTENGYQINKSIRDVCVFAVHNVLANPPFAGIDLISCRNVLIYMDTFLQRKVMATFHYSLNEKGMLLLGKSESSGDSSDLFLPLSESEKAYTRKMVPGRYVHIAAKRRAELLANGNGKALGAERQKDDYQKNVENIILAKSPNGVIINDHLEIVHFRGVTANWIELADGKPSLSVLKIVKRELTVELRSLINKAKTTRLSSRKEGIVMLFPTSKILVTMEVVPLLDTINLYYLILFENTAEIMHTQTSSKVAVTPAEVRSQRLEKELLQTREDMRIIAEDQEAGNEELLSANEELLSGSEELRSLNEELEISKEELQSTVEELSVSNQELAFRIDQLSYARSYSEAIVATIREPLIVLDQHLKVKSANSAFYKAFLCDKLETEGKFFHEIDDHQWDNPDLRLMLERNLVETSFFESFEVKTKSTVLGNRRMLLNARRIVSLENKEQLVLVAFEDVTERRQWETTMKQNAEHLEGILESSPQISFTASLDGTVNYYNNYFVNYAGVTLAQAMDRGWPLFVHPDDLASFVIAWQRSVATGEELHEEMRIKRHDGEYRWHMFRALATWNSDGKIMSWVGTASDIHDQKIFSEKLEKKVKNRTHLLKQANVELENSTKNLEQFAFIASHDLQEPLRKIQVFSSMLTDKFQGQMPPDARTLVTKIGDSTKRMSTLIHDVLNFSLMEKGANVFQVSDLKAILEKVVTDFSLLIADKKANIHIGTLPVIDAIPFQINQLFYNLLSNSLKFTRTGVRPEIRITSRLLPLVEANKHPNLNKKTPYLEILFEDNGIGFEQKFSEKIFDIFQRLHSQSAYPGTGIGLALCKRLVASHHGEIFAEPAEEGGAIFHVIIPYKNQSPPPRSPLGIQ